MRSIALSIRVHGRVQGVGYRNALKEVAERLSVVGWVRNRGDGTVEVQAVGTQEALDSLTRWCGIGSPMARVTQVEVVPVVDVPHYSSFNVFY